MADREKVMRALSVCSKTDCSNCEYNKEVCLINDLLFDALALLKEQDEIIQRVLREKTDELNYKTTTMQIEIQNKEIRKVLEQK